MKKIIIIFIPLSILAMCIGYALARPKIFVKQTVIETIPSTQIMQTYNTKLSYVQLERSPEQYKGAKTTAMGTVVQVSEDGNNVTLRVALNGDDNKIFMATYTTGKDYKRILENDFVTIRGVSNGIYTYKSALDTDITIPLFSVDYITLGNN